MKEQLVHMLETLGHSNVAVWQCSFYSVWRFTSDELVGVQLLGESSAALNNVRQFSLVN
jgi:hypothetical protein